MSHVIRTKTATGVKHSHLINSPRELFVCQKKRRKNNNLDTYCMGKLDVCLDTYCMGKLGVCLDTYCMGKLGVCLDTYCMGKLGVCLDTYCMGKLGVCLDTYCMGKLGVCLDTYCMGKLDVCPRKKPKVLLENVVSGFVFTKDMGIYIRDTFFTLITCQL